MSNNENLEKVTIKKRQIFGHKVINDWQNNRTDKKSFPIDTLYEVDGLKDNVLIPNKAWEKRFKDAYEFYFRFKYKYPNLEQTVDRFSYSSFSSDLIGDTYTFTDSFIWEPYKGIDNVKINKIHFPNIQIILEKGKNYYLPIELINKINLRIGEEAFDLHPEGNFEDIDWTQKNTNLDVKYTGKINKNY